jgi:hypothetical protein
VTVKLGREAVNWMIVPFTVGVDAIVEGGHSIKVVINVINYIGHIDEMVLMHLNAVHVHIGF